MKLKANMKANIRTDDGWITVMKDDIVDLPDRFARHPALDKILEVSKKEVEKKLDEIKEDLADDGKLNYSNNDKKKSPGRKKKGKK